MSLDVKPISDRATLVVVALGTTLVLATYVTPMATIPATAAELGAGAGWRAWMLSSMSVGLAGALLASGVLGDALGRRRVYLLGLCGLGLGAAACALATDPALFVVARVVQGAGGGAVLACGLATLAHVNPPGPRRVQATAVWGASVGLGIGGGSLLAALLEFGSDWRETYAVTAALAALLWVTTRRALPESSAARPRRLDLPGLVLLAAAMSLLVSALTQSRNGLDAATLVLAVAGLAALAGFGLVERRVAEPLLEPGLLGDPRFRSATLGSLVLGLGMIGLAAFVPTYAQLGLGLDLWGAVVLVSAWAGTSVVTALLARRIPHPLVGGLPVAVLLTVVAVGQLLALGVATAGDAWRLAVAMVVTGLGTGVLNAILGRESVASVPPDRAAMGSGANNTARYLGAACGITLFVTVATHAGAGLDEGWDAAVLVVATLTLLGAAVIAVTGRTQPVSA